MKIHFKFDTPSAPNHDFWIYSPYLVLASYSNASLLAQPQETIATGSGPTTCYYIKIKIPQSVAPGTYSICTDPPVGFQVSFTAKNCSCSITSAFTFTTSNFVAILQSQAVGTTTQTQYFWDFGVTSGWQLGAANQTFTYSSAGTYSVGLMVANPTCTDIVFHSITVTQPTVDITGIQEYQLTQPIQYFDFYGNRIEPRKNEILIEQCGTIRRKVVLQ